MLVPSQQPRMAQLLRSPCQGLRRLHQLRATIPPSTSPSGAGIIYLPEITWRFWQARLLSETAALEDSPNMPQKPQRSFGREFKKQDTTDYSKILRGIFKEHTLRETGEPSSEGKHSEQAIVSFREEEGKVGVLDREETPKTKEGAVDLDVESATVVRSSIKTETMGSPSKNLKDIILGSLREERKATKETKSPGKLQQRGQQNLKTNIPSNVLGGTGNKGDSKRQWAQILSINVNSEKSQEKSVSSAHGCHFQQIASLTDDTVKGNDFVNLDYPRGADQTVGAEAASSSPSYSLPSSPSNTTLPHKFHEFFNEAIQKDDFTDTVPIKSATITKKTFGRDNIDMNSQSSFKSEQPNMRNLDSLRSGNSGNFARRGEPNNSSLAIDKAVTLSSEEELTAVSLQDPRFTVCVENLPTKFDLSRIKEALSSYGEITGLFKKAGKNGFSACSIEYKTDEAKENALAARWLYVDGKQFPISRLDQPMTTVVRILNARPETTEIKVLSTCESLGEVDRVKRRARGMFDVYFKARELPNILKIMDSLNDVTLHQSKWKALPAPLVHPQAMEALLQTREGLNWCFSQQVVVVNRMEGTINRVMTDLQDLQELIDIAE